MSKLGQKALQFRRKRAVRTRLAASYAPGAAGLGDSQNCLAVRSGGFAQGAERFEGCASVAVGFEFLDEATPASRGWTSGPAGNDGKRCRTMRGELIMARLTPQGLQEFSRAKLLDPTLDQLRQRGGVTWSHPAFAYRHVFARNDKELVCADLSTKPDGNRQ